MKIFVTYHEAAPIIRNEVLTPIHAGAVLSDEKLEMTSDDTGDHISEKNRAWGELTALYWIWKNVDTDCYGFFHSHRLFALSDGGGAFFRDVCDETLKKMGLDKAYIQSVCSQYDIVMPPKLGEQDFGNFQSLQLLLGQPACKADVSYAEIVLQIIDELCPEYALCAQLMLNKKKWYFFNMFIMSKAYFQQYAQWLFCILFELEKRLEAQGATVCEEGTLSLMAQWLMNVFVFRQKIVREDLKLLEASAVSYGIFDGKYPYGVDLKKPLWLCAHEYAIPKHSASARPKVSVIIPVYNVEKYLAACLNSVVNQTLKDIEIIVVNDGSPDNSQLIIDRYARVDNRIVVIQQENGGLSCARNEGLRHATGEYVTYVDSDDMLDMDALYQLYIKSRQGQVDVVFSLTKTIHPQTEEVVPEPYYNTTILPHYLLEKEFSFQDIKPYLFKMQVSAWNKIYKTELLRRIGATFPPGLAYEDNPFFYDVLINAKEMAFCDKQLYIYRLYRDDAITRSQVKYFDFFKIIGWCEQILKKNNVWQALKYDFWNYRVQVLFRWYSLIKDQVLRQQFFAQLKQEFLSFNMREYEIERLDSRCVDLYCSVLDGSAKSTKPVVPFWEKEMANKERSFLYKVGRRFFKVLRRLGLWLRALARARQNENELNDARKRLVCVEQKMVDVSERHPSLRSQVCDGNKGLDNQSKSL